MAGHGDAEETMVSLKRSMKVDDRHDKHIHIYIIYI